MERLTKRDRGRNARMDCDKCEIKYRENCCSKKLCLNALIDRLAAYEDAEEQGLLIRLPCKVGDTVYVISGKSAFKATVDTLHVEENNRLAIEVHYNNFGLCSLYAGRFGKTVFLTREESEAALKEDCRE